MFPHPDRNTERIQTWGASETSYGLPRPVLRCITVVKILILDRERVATLCQSTNALAW